MRVSVILCTHNPHAERLRRTLAGLCAQTLPPSDWETLLVDNASQPPLSLDSLSTPPPANLRLLHEPTPGLTAARRCGLRAAHPESELCVFVDDDNVLAPTYLASAVALFSERLSLGAAGGPSRPEFEETPQPWTAEFFPLLALRDLGPAPQFARLERTSPHAPAIYPHCAPIGAGMVIRRSAVCSWLDAPTAQTLSDRRGADLTSAGDNDIVLSILEQGLEVAYSPDLALTHLIPASRLTPAYLARLNRSIQKSWMQVLTAHRINPWPPIPRWSVPLRQLKAWFTHRAWSAPAARIRWQGACGHFEGRIAS